MADGLPARGVELVRHGAGPGVRVGQQREGILQEAHMILVNLKEISLCCASLLGDNLKDKNERVYKKRRWIKVNYLVSIKNHHKIGNFDQDKITNSY